MRPVSGTALSSVCPRKRSTVSQAVTLLFPRFPSTRIRSGLRGSGTSRTSSVPEGSAGEPATSARYSLRTVRFRKAADSAFAVPASRANSRSPLVSLSMRWTTKGSGAPGSAASQRSWRRDSAVGASGLQRSFTEARPAGFSTAVQPGPSRRTATSSGRGGLSRRSRPASGERPISKIVTVSPGAGSPRRPVLRAISRP